MQPAGFSADAFYKDLAARFKAISVLFERLGTPKAAQEIIEALASGDAKTFSRFTDLVDYPNLLEGKCAWVRDVIESAAATETTVDECWLRTNLTPAEGRRYLEIAMRHLGTGTPMLTVSSGLGLSRERTIIYPGPFLDELNANGLVECHQVQAWIPTLTLGLRYEVCL